MTIGEQFLREAVPLARHLEQLYRNADAKTILSVHASARSHFEKRVLEMAMAGPHAQDESTRDNDRHECRPRGVVRLCRTSGCSQCVPLAPF